MSDTTNPSLGPGDLAHLRRLLTEARELDDAINPTQDGPPATATGRLDPWEEVRFRVLCKMGEQADQALHAALDYDTLAALLAAAEQGASPETAP